MYIQKANDIEMFNKFPLQALLQDHHLSCTCPNLCSRRNQATLLLKQHCYTFQLHYNF